MLCERAQEMIDVDASSRARRAVERRAVEGADCERERRAVDRRLERDGRSGSHAIEKDRLDGELQVVHLLVLELEARCEPADEKADDAVEAALVRNCQGE